MSLKTKALVISVIVLLAIGLAYAFYTHNRPVATGTSPSVAPAQSGSVVAEQPAQCHMNGELPDAACTPGAVNPDVTQANINQTICVSGYTATIRPPASYTNKLKAQQMQAYGFTDSIRAHEEDHLISLELGGAPSDAKNLWPEPHASPNPKDKVENFLHAAVCGGRITLTEAQHRIATNWMTAETGL
jgi:hypothetical protein